MPEVIISSDRRYATVKLYGQLWQRQDMQDLDEDIARLFAQNIRNIVLDMERLSFVDSEGLGKFITIHNKFKEIGGQMFFYRPHGPVCEVIELSAIDTVIPIIKEEADLNKVLAALPPA
jgi:stage II sporulation protein AA (anti-sigma F factor antagonist)